jgi:hypothetical protein
MGGGSARPTFVEIVAHPRRAAGFAINRAFFDFIGIER